MYIIVFEFPSRGTLWNITLTQYSHHVGVWVINTALKYT